MLYAQNFIVCNLYTFLMEINIFLKPLFFKYSFLEQIKIDMASVQKQNIYFPTC